MLRVEQPALDFTLPDADMEMVALADYRDKQYVVLYFYPKDDSPGCTREAIDFSDSTTSSRSCARQSSGSVAMNASHTEISVTNMDCRCVCCPIPMPRFARSMACCRKRKSRECGVSAFPVRHLSSTEAACYGMCSMASSPLVTRTRCPSSCAA